jgi:hypothetical protein
MSSVHGEGRVAYSNRLPLSANPYKDGPEYKFKEWMYGWLDQSHQRMVNNERYQKDMRKIKGP